MQAEWLRTSHPAPTSFRFPERSGSLIWRDTLFSRGPALASLETLE